MISKKTAFMMLMILPGLGLEIRGQMATGNIGGQVVDSSGAVVPNAKVAIVHLSTGQSRTLVTNDRGEFLAPLLPIGVYEVSAEFSGFKRQRKQIVAATIENLAPQGCVCTS